MKYHIETIPVWDAFKARCGCPLCSISDELETKALKLYSTDAVMSPEYRVEVNKRGFCRRHARLLYEGENKLGLALQLETRSDALKSLPLRVSSVKDAAKLADKLEHACGCVICDDYKKSLPRYYSTVAELYDNESEFRPLFHSCIICYDHTIELLRTANECKHNRQAYLDAICYKLTEELKSNAAALNDFAEAFDYTKTNKTADPDVLPRALDLLYGTQVKPYRNKN